MDGLKYDLIMACTASLLVTLLMTYVATRAALSSDSFDGSVLAPSSDIVSCQLSGEEVKALVPDS